MINKRFISLSVLFFIAINYLTAQLKPTDILKLKYAYSKTLSDTARINIFIELANGYRFSNIDSGLYYADKAFELSTEINYTKGQIGAMDAKSFILLESGDIPQSLNSTVTALNLLKNNPDMQLMGDLYNRYGNIYMELKEYESAIKYYRISQEYYEKINHDLRYNEISNIGNVYELMGKLDSARYYQQIVLEGSRTNIDRGSIVRGEMRARLGNVESRLGNHDAALMHYRKGISESLVDFDFRDLALNYIQIAKLFQSINNYDSSFFYAKKTIETGRPISFKKAIYEASDLLAHWFKLRNRSDSAMHYYEISIAYKDSLYGPDIFKKLQLIALREQQLQQELQTENEKLKTRNRQIVFYSAIIVLILFVLLLWYNFKKQKNTNRKLISQKNIIEKRTLELVEEKKKSDNLLHNILPEEVAEELKTRGSAEAKHFDEVTVLFTDFKNFTQITEKMTPQEMVAEIDTCFKAFDQIIDKYDIEKIKTIGDSYMCAAGLPVARETHAEDVVAAALEIQQFINKRVAEKTASGKDPFQVRIGIHTGPVVAGIVGIKKFAYDIWGDTVNTASRMESSGEAGKVNISGATYELVKDKFRCTPRGKIMAKHKGEMEMYFVEGKI